MTHVNIGPGGTPDLDNWFTYHAPMPEQVTRYTTLRSAGKSLAEHIADACPPSPERSTALAKVREAVMWANAAIACNETNDPVGATMMDKDQRPHSRACGIRVHDHGPACHSNCPTCHGKDEEA